MRGKLIAICVRKVLRDEYVFRSQHLVTATEHNMKRWDVCGIVGTNPLPIGASVPTIGIGAIGARLEEVGKLT